MGWGPHGLGAPWVGGTQGFGAPMGWGPQRVSGRVYETKPIIAVFFFSFRSKNAVLKSSFLFIPLIEKMDSPIWGTPLAVADYQLGLLGLA
jgi:hypothetical protein